MVKICRQKIKPFICSFSLLSSRYHCYLPKSPISTASLFTFIMDAHLEEGCNYPRWRNLEQKKGARGSVLHIQHLKQLLNTCHTNGSLLPHYLFIEVSLIFPMKLNALHLDHYLIIIQDTHSWFSKLTEGRQLPAKFLKTMQEVEQEE